MKKFKTSKEGIEFFEHFTCPLFWKAQQMSNYYYNLLEKRWELAWNYKKKNEIIWDMFWDWEMAISEIDDDLHALNYRYDLKTEEDKLGWLNRMLEEYAWYLQR